MAQARGIWGHGQPINEVQQQAIFLLMVNDAYLKKREAEAMAGAFTEEPDEIDITEWDGQGEVEMVVRDDLTTEEIQMLMSRVNHKTIELEAVPGTTKK